jgi:hypothetical protein
MKIKKLYLIISAMIFAVVTFLATPALLAVGQYEKWTERSQLFYGLTKLQRNDPQLAERFWNEVSEVREKVASMVATMKEIDDGYQMPRIYNEVLPDLRPSFQKLIATAQKIDNLHLLPFSLADHLKRFDLEGTSCSKGPMAYMIDGLFLESDMDMINSLKGDVYELAEVLKGQVQEGQMSTMERVKRFCGI